MIQALSRRALLVTLGLTIALAAFVAGDPIPQSLAYHDMADQRTWLGIPNAANVLSNLPFAVIGSLGLLALFRSDGRRTPFDNSWERWPYVALFAGILLTTFGSGYYHLAPDNGRLVWDRLPMAVGFMGLLTTVIAERVSPALGRRLFVPLLVFGATTVIYWYWSELQGAGDLRPYLLVQFGSLCSVVLLLALYPGRYGGSGYLVAGLAAYAAAKGFESADASIYAAGGLVSGHTLKHLAAATAVGCLFAMIRARGAGAMARVPPAAAT